MKMFCGICLAVAAMAMVHTASGADWTLKLGANYRTFGEAELTAFSFSNPDAVTGSGFVSGNLPSTMTVNVVDQGLQVDLGGGFADLHKVSFAGGCDDDIDNSFGVVIAAAKPLNETWDLELSLTVNALDSGASASAIGTTERYNTSAAGGAWTPFAGGAKGTEAQWVDLGGTGWAGPLLAPVGGYQVDATGSVDYDFEVDIYTFGVGVTTDMELSDNVGVALSIGPTLTLGDFSVKRTESAFFTDDDDDPTPIYDPETLSDDGLEVIFGAYASVSVGVAFGEQFSLAAGLRYDYAANQLATDLADLELSGFSSELKLVFSF